MKYTRELTQTIIDCYKNGATVSEIATRLGSTDNSIRSKLVAEGVYKKAVKTKRIPKSEYIDRFCDLIGYYDFTSIDKLSIADLKILISRLTNK